MADLRQLKEHQDQLPERMRGSHYECPGCGRVLSSPECPDCGLKAECCRTIPYDFES